jgi:hypothetical protein
MEFCFNPWVLDPTLHPDLNLAPALDVLRTHRVRWVLTGSLVLAAYGARIVPGDLDITPDLHPDNVEALARVAAEVDAIPFHDPDWPRCPPLESHYEWSPIPATIDNLDHLMVTTVGMLDFVPRLCGTYRDLRPGAMSLEVGGTQVLVADPATVLERLRGRTRRKDVDRRAEIDRLERAINAGTAQLTGLDHLI